MRRLRELGLVYAIASTGVTVPVVHAQTFSDQTVLLIQQFGTEVVLTDEDGDGLITDRDFSLLLFDRVFDNGLEDHDCDGVVNEVDAVLAMAAELRSLASDFDGSGVIAAYDVAHVTTNLGMGEAKARHGDINGDSLVDELDFLETCNRLGRPVELDPTATAYEILEMMLALEPWMASLPAPIGEPCPAPEPCGSATCKVRCVNAATGGKWTYRLFMVGFCGSQFEASGCCEAVKAIACNCSPDGFSLSCWVQAQGAYVACLIAAPG